MRLKYLHIPNLNLELNPSPRHVKSFRLDPAGRELPFRSNDSRRGRCVNHLHLLQMLPLIAKVNGYGIIYNWIDHLKRQGHYINGYVIMPNQIQTEMGDVQLSKTSPKT